MILSEIFKAVERLYLDDAFDDITVEIFSDNAVITAATKLYEPNDEIGGDILPLK